MTGLIFTAAVSTAACTLAAAALVRQSRAARTVIRSTQDEWDTRVPYWPAEDAEIVATHTLLLTLLCGPCRGYDGEDCTCSIQCGQPACMGGFGDEDIEFLQSLSMPEGTDQ